MRLVQWMTMNIKTPCVCTSISTQRKSVQPDSWQEITNMKLGVWLARRQLKWKSLKKRRKDNRLILLYKGLGSLLIFLLKGKASIPTDDLTPKTKRGRNQHSMAFQTPIVNTDVYKCSFFSQTIRDWNALPDSLISSAEDAEDCVAKFTSLVRVRD